MPTPNPTRPYSIPGFRIALVREPGVKLAERRYFDYLRAIDGNGETVKRVKAWILDEYRKGAAA